MSAYLIAEIEVTDPETYEEYRRQVAPTVERYGGRMDAQAPGGHRVLRHGQPQGMVPV